MPDRSPYAVAVQTVFTNPIHAVSDSWTIAADQAFIHDRGLVPNVVVRIAGGVIEDVVIGGNRSADAVYIEGATLLPGLIDPHQHLSFSADHSVIEHLTRDSSEVLAARSAGNAQRALASGVTTVVDCGGHSNVILGLRDSAERGLLTLPRIVSCGAPITTTAGHCHWLGGVADSQSDVIKLVREQIGRGADFVKVMLSGGNLTAGTNPAQLQYEPSVMEALAKECRRLNRPLVAHVHSAEAIELAALVGVTVVAHGTCMHQNGDVGATAAIIKALVDNGVFVDPTLMVGKRSGSQDLSARGVLREMMLPSFAAMFKAGVPLLAGTDAGVPGIGHDSLSGSIDSLVSEVGLSIEDALAGASHRVADAFKLHSRGRLAAGTDADLVLVPGDLATSTQGLGRPHAVWTRGRLVAGNVIAMAGLHWPDPTRVST